MGKSKITSEIESATPVIISEKMARRWLKGLGLNYGRFRPGLYNEGHKRPDVVKYREKFLDRFEEYERRMVQYEGEFMESALLPSFSAGERALVLVTHDCSCFSSHDGLDFVWLDENNMPIRPKGDGRSIMISAFLCECHGLLNLSESEKQRNPDIASDSTVILKPGTNADGYWKNAGQSYIQGPSSRF